jgi:PAS domain S-box-containing protein
VEEFVGPLRPEPEHREHRDRLLGVLIPTCAVGALLAALASLTEGQGHAAAALGFAAAGSLFAHVVHRAGRGGLAGLILLLVMLSVQYRLMSVGFGIHDIAIVIYPLILIVAALLFDLRLLLFASVACIASAALAVSKDLGATAQLAGATSLQDLFGIVTVVVVTTVALRAITLDFVRVAYRERLQQRELRGLNEALQRYAAGLEASEARWRTLIATAPDRILSVGEDGRIAFVSDDAQGAGSLVGRPVGELTEPERRAPLEAAVRDAFVWQRSARLEVPGWGPGGNPAWWALRVAPVVENGAVRSVTLIATDVWERKQIEAEREALIRELEARNTELEGFTYTVSHDLKSPLITIRAFLGFVEKAADKGDVEAVRADLARIADAADRMRRLLDDLLDLSRVGRTTNPTEPVAFESVAREAIANVQGQIAVRGAKVTVAQGLPLVHVDQARIVQVLQNLLENATKFLGEQANPRIVIGQRGWEGEMPVLYVQDNGAGIEPRFRERIFGLFEKLDPASAGTGVGLALVRRIVEFHGGRVWVESEGKGTGATFLFTLPTREPSGEDSGRRRRLVADARV